MTVPTYVSYILIHFLFFFSLSSSSLFRTHDGDDLTPTPSPHDHFLLINEVRFPPAQHTLRRLRGVFFQPTTPSHAATDATML
ncbi:hypothetical protein BDN72DRAFT_896067 [Pluteus cervinus]|uniref:Uncharacterized protein n=1 Tax=Pluteus cervinus TaxID=181527 RepID=A0ACD3AZR0_9AGAR|nr:hypothetical protein BDN72DRAFT_896067 [Pluteus cervinus]